jgi:periplasmic protein TonB
MFDLITGATDHIPRRPAVPVLISLTAQVGLVTAVGVASVVIGGNQLPEAPTMMAFVAEAPAAPPPPPPPVAPTPARAVRPAARTAVSAAALPPAEAPAQIEFEPAAGEEGLEEGARGGVEGGVPGGVAGGLVSELPPPPPPPAPPPPAPQAPAAPVRVGGKVPQPSLLHRVEPVYPRAAVDARMQGVVILETIVGEDDRVLEVRLLRSAGEVLDREAIAAIRQWRYAPLEINGVPVRFLLTATLSFKLDT